MTLTWEVLEEEIQEGLADSRVKSGLLKANLSVLLVKNVIDYWSNVNDVQQYLEERFHVEYKLVDIEDELTCMKFEKEDAEKAIPECEEDFYPGY